MLYTVTTPSSQADRIRLYPRADAARSESGGRPLVGVAARFDAKGRRVVPLWTDPKRFDPAWATPAELHADGSVTAKGPIPTPLFVEFEQPTPGESPENRHPRLLIVDDHAPTRNALLAIFAGKGWDVIAVGTLADGLARLEPPPECLILDLALPDGRGEAILRRVREWQLKTRVAIYSAIHDPARLGAVLELRPDILLSKPMGLADLCQALESQMVTPRPSAAPPPPVELPPPGSGETIRLPSSILHRVESGGAR